MSESAENINLSRIDVPTGDSNDGTSFTKFVKTNTCVAGHGTLFDAFLMEASLQIGQSIMIMPWIFANLGYAGGTLLLVLFAGTSLYSQFLLTSLLAQYRQRLDQEGDKNNNNEKHVASYYEVISYLCGPYWGYFSLLVVILALLGLSTAQIISTASNLYALNNSLDKRSLTLISGGVFSSLCLVPTFRHYRVVAITALLATTYTAWYMTIASALEGPPPDNNDCEEEGPSVQEFFTAFTALLFTFGGHTASVERADVMDDRKKYDFGFGLAILYAFVIAFPNGVTTLHAFGADTVRQNENAFFLFSDNDIFRNIGIVLMCLHDFVAF